MSVLASFKVCPQLAIYLAKDEVMTGTGTSQEPASDVSFKVGPQLAIYFNQRPSYDRPPERLKNRPPDISSCEFFGWSPAHDLLLPKTKL